MMNRMSQDDLSGKLVESRASHLAILGTASTKMIICISSMV